MPNPTDLTQEELLGVAERIDRALRRRHLLPFQSLQYRLGEAGRKRVHPIALQRALTALARRPTRRSTVAHALQPWILEPYIYASPELSKAEADAELSSRRSEVEYIAGVNWDSGFQELIRAVEKHTGNLRPLKVDYPIEDTPLADPHRIQSSQQVYHLRRTRERPVYLWATQRSNWIHPMDPALWQFLSRCAEDGARPLVLARYIDPATFVLFKALHVQGLQYYAMWIPDSEYSRTASTAERLGWFYVQPPEKKTAHPIFGQLRRSVEHLSGTPWEDARSAIEAAIQAGLGAVNRSIAVDPLLAWAREERVSLPLPWLQTLERWSIWLQGRPLQLPSKGKRKSTSPPADQKPSSTAPASKHPTPQTGSELDGAVDQESHGFGRKTTITRVPLRLR